MREKWELSVSLLGMAVILIGLTEVFIIANRHVHTWVDSRLDMVPIHEKMMPDAESRVLMCLDCGALKLDDDYVRSWRPDLLLPESRKAAQTGTMVIERGEENWVR